MNRLLSAAALAALAAVACDPEPSAPPTACGADAIGSWAPEGGVLLACSGNALAVAVRGPQTPVVSDGRTILEVTARLGLDFRLTAAQVELAAKGGVFPGARSTAADGGTAEADRIVVSTDERGVLTTPLKVSAGAREVVLHARVVGHANSADAGVGVAETFVHVPLVPPSISRTLISADGGTALRPGGALTLEVRAYFDEWLEVPAANAPIELCLGDNQHLLTTNWLHRPLDGTGAAQVVVQASRDLPESGQVRLRACPSALACVESASCGALQVPLKPAVPPIQAIALGSDAPSIKVGELRTLTALAYTDTRLSSPAAAGAALRFCATSPGVLEPNLAALDGEGKATVKLRALPGSGAATIKVTACPYEIDCQRLDLPTACSAELILPLSEADPAIGAMVVSFSSPPLVEDRAGTVVVAAFSDSRRTQKSPENAPVRFCVDGQLASLSSTSGFLDATGRTSVLVTPRPRTAAQPGELTFTACPYEVACDAGAPACQAERVAIVEAPPDAGTDGGVADGDAGVVDGGA